MSKQEIISRCYFHCIGISNVFNLINKINTSENEKENIDLPCTSSFLDWELFFPTCPVCNYFGQEKIIVWSTGSVHINVLPWTLMVEDFPSQSQGIYCLSQNILFVSCSSMRCCFLRQFPIILSLMVSKAYSSELYVCFYLVSFLWPWELCTSADKASVFKPWLVVM